MKNSTAQSRKNQSDRSIPMERMNGSRSGDLDPIGDIQTYVRQYAREQPEMSMLICLGVGFVLGWKLKPW